MLLLEIIYLLSAALLAAYGLNSLLHTWLYVRKGRDRSYYSTYTRADLTSGNLPSVTVQLPVYNERYVVNRLMVAVLNLSWPADRLQIQILDDSTDETTQIITNILERVDHRGIQIEHIRRQLREDYKAGALKVGMETAVGEFIVIFDADFVPPSDFLLNTIPLFNVEPGMEPVGCVQARWGHMNADMSLLTEAQSLGIDGHFIVEQAARHRVGAFMNFNGTAGIWRRACLDAVGGWKGDTLTEDLDLSYRAQLAGWRVVYQPEVIVPAELPVQLVGFKRQQFRWAKGSIQTAKKLMGQLWRSDTSLWRKVLGTLHLTNYAIHPLMVLNLLLTLPMSLSHSPLLYLAPIFMMSAIGPPLMYWVAMNETLDMKPLKNRLGRLLMLVVLGMGLSANNTRAVLEALFGLKSGFKRTPKFAVTDKQTTWQGSSYTLPKDSTIWMEGVLLIYALSLIIWSVTHSMWWLIGWLLLYALGYAVMIGLVLKQSRQNQAQTAVSLGITGTVKSGD
jgi:cellulose synthase/poly-beta-1,6-N-acetylglucosamine synthase-like glycosyltransferase